MAASDLLVRVQELGGTWLPIGTEKNRGIWVDPNDFSADADGWGSRQLSAKLRYDPRVLQPHISAFTPGELEIGGIPCWSGREKEAQAQDGDDRSITPTFEGWQNHLDDDGYQLQYIHTNLTDWQDAKQGLSTKLAANEYAQAGSVSTDQQGLIILGIPNTTVVPLARRIGVYLDLGPDTLAAACYVDWQSSNNQVNESLFCRGMNVPQFGSQDTTYGVSDAIFSMSNTTGASGTTGGAFSTPSRYIVIFTYANPSGYTAAVDIWWKLAGIRVFASTTYHSSGASILVGSTIVKDAIARATLLLSPDMSQVAATPFVLPEFAMSDYQSTRDVTIAALAFDDYIPRITVEKQPSVRPRPVLPMYEVGDWAGAAFQDASTNSGDQVFNSVVVSGTDPTGAPFRVRRSQVPSFFSPSAIQPTNPTAAVNTTGWTGTGGTLSRDTVTFDSAPASFKCALAGAGSLNLQTASWTGGTFVPGQTYRLTLRFRTSTAFVGAAIVVDANGQQLANVNPGSPGAFAPVVLTFTPQTSGSPTLLVAGDLFLAGSIWVDSVTLEQGAATLVDRRAFRRTYRLNTNMSLTADAAAALGDVFLAGHRTTPFKGTLALSGPGSIRRVRGGQNVTMAELLRNTGELILFSHLTDPDTGGNGRYGRIASVSLNGPWSAQVQIDSTDDNLQALLNRIQVNTAQVR